MQIRLISELTREELEQAYLELVDLLEGIGAGGVDGTVLLRPEEDKE